MEKGYIIQSISEEGIYYLCNGWNKHKTFWVNYANIDNAIFKTQGQAKSSLTKLLKIMPEYSSDNFNIAKIYNDYTIIKLSEFGNK